LVGSAAEPTKAPSMGPDAHHRAAVGSGPAEPTADNQTPQAPA